MVDLRIKWNNVYENTLENNLHTWGKYVGLAATASRKIVLPRAVSLLKQSSESQQILQFWANQDSLSSYLQQM